MKGVFQLPEGVLHAVEIPDIAGLHLTLRLSKLLQNALGHAGIGVPLLGAPLTLLLDELHQLRNGFAAELLCAAMGADLDLRDMIPQGLVLRRRLPQRLVLPAQGGQLLLHALHLAAQGGLVVQPLRQLVQLHTQRRVFRLRTAFLRQQLLTLRRQGVQPLLRLRRCFFNKGDHILPVESPE